MALSTQNKWIIGISSALGLTLIALAFKDKWMRIESVVETGDGNDIDAKMEKLTKSFSANPPKTKEEARARSLEFGVTEQDLKDYMTKKLFGGNGLQQNKVVESGGNASHNDSIGQKYILTADYNAMQSNSAKIVSKDFKKGSLFEKKSDKNLAMVNGQNSVKVYAENDEFVIPTTLLKKS